MESRASSPQTCAARPSPDPPALTGTLPQAFDAAQDVAAVKPYVVAMQHILRYAPRSAPPQSPLTRCLAT